MSTLEAMASSAVNPGPDYLQQSLRLMGMPVSIISSYFPGVFQMCKRYPKLMKALSLPLLAYLIFSYAPRKVSTLLQYLMSHFMSYIKISVDDVKLLESYQQFVQLKYLFLPERGMFARSSTFLHNQTHDRYGYRTQKRKPIPGQAINYESLSQFQIFHHCGRFFFVTRGPSISEDRACREYTLWCLGWSPEPIKTLMEEAYASHRLQEKEVMTNIYAPFDHCQQWRVRCGQPRRPLQTVYLDRGQKTKIINDVQDYLAPGTKKWYSDRGIPYRRGYLFHGQPGTGKTSLALALAGHFKLDVYILSLLDPILTDASLQLLFQSLRPGVIILLEDVDSAGLDRENTSKGTTGRLAPIDEVGNELDIEMMTELKKQRKVVKKRKDARTQASVTLSGLLNAIDGAGAPQGHLLILTTNKPENLDYALVRAGRVDVRVKFEYASKSQTSDIFVNMYRPQREKGWQKNEKAVEAYQTRMKELKDMARRFAAKVPSRALSPAQLQDFILTKKADPEQAICDIQGWMMEECGLEAKDLANGLCHDEGREDVGYESFEESDDEAEDDEDDDDDDYGNTGSGGSGVDESDYGGTVVSRKSSWLRRELESASF